MTFPSFQVKLDHDDDDGDSEFEISDEEDEEEEVKKTLTPVRCFFDPGSEIGFFWILDIQPIFLRA
jgi:hypothetical protein